MPVKGTTQEHATLPRRKLDDYAWLSIHVPRDMLDLLRDVAATEERAISTLGRRLIEEALAARGLDLPWRAVTEMDRTRQSGASQKREREQERDRDRDADDVDERIVGDRGPSSATSAPVESAE